MPINSDEGAGDVAEFRWQVVNVGRGFLHIGLAMIAADDVARLIRIAQSVALAGNDRGTHGAEQVGCIVFGREAGNVGPWLASAVVVESLEASGISAVVTINANAECAGVTVFSRVLVIECSDQRIVSVGEFAVNFASSAGCA